MKTLTPCTIHVGEIAPGQWEAEIELTPAVRARMPRIDKRAVYWHRIACGETADKCMSRVNAWLKRNLPDSIASIYRP